MRRLAKQISQKPSKALSELDKACSWGSKRNSQWNVSDWKGYKLHLDTTESGISVTTVVTAHAHDSQLAIPMEKLTERRVPLIDTNRRGSREGLIQAHPGHGCAHRCQGPSVSDRTAPESGIKAFPENKSNASPDFVLWYSS
jgi:hypothetical protein